MNSSSITLPRKLPLLVLADGILLPGSSMRIPVTTSKNMNMVKSRLLSRSTLTSTVIGVVPKTTHQDIEDLDAFNTMHSIGTAAVVVQVTGTNWPRPAYTLLVTGLCRFKLERLVQESPYPIAYVTQLDKFSVDGEYFEEGANPELNGLIENFKEQATRLLDMLDVSTPMVARLKNMLDSLPSHHLADIYASIVKASYDEKLQILDAVDLTERFRKTLPILMRQIEGLQLIKKAKQSNGIRAIPLKRNRIIPFEGMHPGERDADEITNLEEKIKAADLPEEARRVAVKELQRLKKMGSHMPENAMTRNYLELLVELPWSKTSPETIDIQKARTDLDEDHYAMDKMKKRVLEYLAVRQLRNTLKGPILCFVGPPGVGKTSLGRSVARTLGRGFHRISLGGVCDQSDIRGHRRTYIGSMPGRIIQGLKIVGTNNPVFLLDEIDKMTKSIHGDPSAALLEVLDPEQNSVFVDHYLNVPFDLSQVMFIATANSTKTIPAPLLDRMEVIHVPGYTHEEKLHIATHHLIPKQFSEHGLSEEVMKIPEDSVKILVSKYTREAGVRNLERKIGALCRAVAVKVAEKSSLKQTKEDLDTEGRTDKVSTEELSEVAKLTLEPPEIPIVIDEAAVEDILGPPMYTNEISGRLGQPGVAVGLAWTTFGGEIMFVEATKIEGEGQLVLTGQLGDVMKESAKLALNWVRSHIREYDIPFVGSDVMENLDVHIHFPAGAVEKDGPSAGITIVTVLMSLFSNRIVMSDVAMTGEVTLRGLVLPVGGIKYKVLAAHRAGLKRVILPKHCEKDLHEIPANVQADLQFIFVNQVDEVLQAAFEGGLKKTTAQVEIPPSKL